MTFDSNRAILNTFLNDFSDIPEIFIMSALYLHLTTWFLPWQNRAEFAVAKVATSVISKLHHLSSLFTVAIKFNSVCKNRSYEREEKAFGGIMVHIKLIFQLNLTLRYFFESRFEG